MNMAWATPGFSTAWVGWGRKLATGCPPYLYTNRPSSRARGALRASRIEGGREREGGKEREGEGRREGGRGRERRGKRGRGEREGDGRRRKKRRVGGGEGGGKVTVTGTKI